MDIALPVRDKAAARRVARGMVSGREMGDKLFVGPDGAADQDRQIERECGCR